MGTIRNTKSRAYTVEQDHWLIKNFSNMTCSQCADLFNKTFNKNVSWKKLVQHCRRTLKLSGNKNHFFTEEQDNFLLDNYKRLDNPTLCKLFNKKFDKQITTSTLCNRVNKLGGKKDIYYTKEEIEWLKENYIKDETVAQTYEKYVKMFGNRKSKIGIESFCKKKLKVKKPNSHKFYKGQKHLNSYGRDRRKQYALANNISNMEDYVLTSDNKLIPKSIYTTMSFEKELHKGELTDLFIDIRLAKKQVERNGSL